MKKRLYLVRHGETIWNLEKRVQGNQKDSALTAQGMEQADQMGASLKKFPIDAFLSSPLGRTLQTSAIIQRHIPHLPILQENLIREMHFGEWEGKDWTDVEQQWPQEYHNWQDAPHDYSPVGAEGETFHEVRLRAQYFLEKIWQERPESHILVVSHAVFIKSLLAFVADIPVSNVWTHTPFSRRISPFIFDMVASTEFSFLEKFESGASL